MNRKYKSIVFSVVLAFCMFFCSGCSDLSFSDNSIIRPPRATGDKAEIQDIISKNAGGKYTLKYPQNGDYRSAIIMHNSQQTDESAVALYSIDNDPNIQVCIISLVDNEWKCIGNFTSSASGVDRVMFEDISGDGKDDLIIGWNAYNSQKTLSAYSFENDAIREMAIDDTYSEIIVADITNDGTDDIMLLSLSGTDTPSMAKLLQYSEQEKHPIGKFSLELDPEITSFTNVFVGNIESGKTGIIADGEKSGGLLSTQIIYFDEKANELRNPLVTIKNGTVTNATTRKDIIISRDIDGDGTIEVPVTSQMSASSNDKTETLCSVTYWKQLKTADNSLNTKMTTVINYTDGYYFIMPDRWIGNVTAKTDPENRNMTFYMWNSKTGSVGDKLLTIYRFNDSEWQNTDKSELIQIDVNNSSSKAIFAAQLFMTHAKDSLNITESEVRNSLKLIS
ncbi:MAG: hypothetical protein PUG48_08165 [Clostridia bacterium]|nr:hypothetical protein [Clostridia bacterium]